MAKEYWLDWARMDDAMKGYPRGSVLPGGFKTLKEARQYAADLVKANHPIIAGEDLIMKFGSRAYYIKSVKMNGDYVYVRIPILKDGSLSRVKPTTKDIVKKSEMSWENY